MITMLQAVVVRDVVGTHSSQHGSDLLPLLSTLINQAVGEEGAAATRYTKNYRKKSKQTIV